MCDEPKLKFNKKAQKAKNTAVKSCGGGLACCKLSLQIEKKEKAYE